MFKAEVGRKIERAELIRMLKTTNIMRDKVAVSVMWLTGCKPSDVLRIRKSDIRIDKMSLSIRLPYKTFDFPRPFCPEDVLIENVVWYVCRMDDGLLFNIKPQMLRLIVRNMGLMLGMRVNSNNFRRRE